MAKQMSQKGTSTVINKTVDVPFNIQTTGGMRTQSINPVGLGSRDGSLTVTATPMGNIFLYTNESCARWVSIMYEIIMSGDTVLIEALFYIGDMLTQPHMQFSNSASNIFQPTRAPQEINDTFGSTRNQ